MNRRDALRSITLTAGVAGVGGLLPALSSCAHETHAPQSAPVLLLEPSFDRALPILPSAPPTLTLSAASATTSIRKGALSPSMSYGGNIYGPTIDVAMNDAVAVRLVNNLSVDTNIHWHGLAVPADMDGHPSRVAAPGSSIPYAFVIQQRACHAWYHSHVHGETGRQVTMGLAGSVLVRDAAEAALGLPTGVDEVVLMIQDKRLDMAGHQTYAPSASDIMNGHLGNHCTVNGMIGPVLATSRGWKRLRIVNASTARVFNLGMSDGIPMVVIGSDGGLLGAPQATRDVLLSPGERLDVLIDLSSLPAGGNAFLETRPFGGSATQGTNGVRVLRFDATAELGPSFTVPAALVPQPPISEEQAVRVRTFDIANIHDGGHDGHAGHGSMGHTINGIRYRMERTDIEVEANSVERWVFDNTKGTEVHPMHVHGAFMRILQRTGGRGTLATHEGGIKDTVLCMPGERVEVLVAIERHRGMYLLHCHQIEHSDDGMMLNMEVR